MLVAAASLCLLVLALSIVHHDLAQMHPSEVRSALSQVSWQAIGIAVLGTVGSYLPLMGYDVLALRYLNRPLPYPRVALVSFVATVIGHDVGMAVLSAGAVRFRLYAALGLEAAETATAVVLVGLTFGVGVTFVGGLILILEPELFSGLAPLSESTARGIGLALVSLVVVYAGVGTGGACLPEPVICRPGVVCAAARFCGNRLYRLPRHLCDGGGGQYREPHPRGTGRVRGSPAAGLARRCA